MYRYQVRYRRQEPSDRVYRVTVTARDAEDARRMAEIADPAFWATTRSPRRMGEVLPPETSDPMTAAKARDDLLAGVAHFDWRGHDIEVEVAP